LSTRCTDTENLYRREREKRQRLEKKMGYPSSIAEKRAMTHEAKRGSYSFEQQKLPILFISSVDDDDDNDELGESRRQQHQHYRLSQKI
jgi:hypothetical protein